MSDTDIKNGLVIDEHGNKSWNENGEKNGGFMDNH